MNYDYNPFGGNNDFDYYGKITVNDAKKAVSRTSLGLFLFSAVSSIVIAAILVLLMITLGKDGYTALAKNPYFYIPLSTLAMYVVGFPLLWLCIRSLPTRTTPNEKTLSVAELLAIIPVMQFATNIGSSVGMGFDGILQEIFHTTSENPNEFLTEGVPVWLMIVITVIICPILEEFVFRKLILDRLSVYGNIFAIVVSAGMFGLFHGNFIQMFYSFLVGIIMGYVTVKGGSWLFGAGLHIFMNFVNGAIPTLLSDHNVRFENALIAWIDGNSDVFVENFQSFMLVGSFAVILNILSITGAVILVYTATKRLIHVNDAPEAVIPAGKLGAVLFTSIGTVLFLLYTTYSVITQYIHLV